jgi:hypothetical protein
MVPGYPVVLNYGKFKVLEIEVIGAVRVRPGSHIIRKLKVFMYLNSYISDVTWV